MARTSEKSRINKDANISRVFRKETAKPLFFQPKLAIGPVNDPHEQEADAMADRVVNAKTTPAVQAKFFPVVQKKCAACEEEEIQRKSDEPGTAQKDAPSIVSDAINSQGNPMDATTKSFMESRFGYDFSNVKIHTDSLAARSAQSIQAHAYTHGKDIVFNEGQYSPGTDSGKKLLAHELTHVVQQSHTQSSTQRMVQRQQMPCEGLLAAPQGPSISGVAAHAVIVADFMSKVNGAVKISIPGASAAPQRTEGSPGNNDKIDPQIIGGLAGTGFPDLSRKAGPVLEVAELKPATWFWLAEGLSQVSRYIEHGNATDSIAQTWRTNNGLSSVIPMLPTSYTPPQTLMVGTTQIQVAWCGPGLIVYKTLNNDEEPPPVYDWKPEPAWDKVLYLAMIASMAAAAKKMGMKLNPAVRYASLVAMFYLIGSGKAEAKLKLGGDDALEALFKSMEQEGVKVPADVKEMFQKDPELKKLVEEATKKSKTLSDVQKQVAKKYTEYISQHINEFSKEELEAILSTTGQISDKIPADVKTEDIKKLIQEKIKQKDNPTKTKTEGEGAKEGGSSTDVKDKEKTAPKLSENSLKTLKEASEARRNLFDTWLKKQKSGDQSVTNENIEKFFKAIPADLTKEQSDYLIANMTPGGTADESLQHILEALESMKKGEQKKDGDEDGSDSVAQKSPETSNDGGIPKEEYSKKMVEKIKAKDFSGFKGFQIVRAGKKKATDAKTGEQYDAILYRWINFHETPDPNSKVTKMKSAAVVTVKVTSEKPFTVEVISSGSVVFENGNTEGGIKPGTHFIKEK